MNIDLNHRLIKSRCVNDPCLSRSVLILDKHCIYAACLSLKRCIKRSYQSKVPSIQFKHCFFPLSFFSTAVLYLLMFESSIVIVNSVKELGPFYNLCWVHIWPRLYSGTEAGFSVTKIIPFLRYCPAWPPIQESLPHLASRSHLAKNETIKHPFQKGL